MAVHQIVGALVNINTDERLARLNVRVIDLDAGIKPKELGYDITNGHGLFTFAYTTAVKVGPTSSRRLRLKIFDSAGRQIHQTDVQVTPGQKGILEIRTPSPEPPAPKSPTIRELNSSLKLGLTRSSLDKLARAGLRSLEDIRKAGGLSRVRGLPENQQKTLGAHANLYALSSDTNLNASLIKRGYTSPYAIAKASPRDLLKTVPTKQGKAKLAQIQVMAKAQTQFLNNLMLGIGANTANGFPPLQGSPQLATWYAASCGCRDCESGVSPLAYLADLLDYAITHLRNDGAAVSVGDLEDLFHQPFGRLPASCSELEKQVRQVRLCIEVLRRYWEALPTQPQVKQDAWEAVEQAHRQAAYISLLTRIGTAYTELRLARTASERTRAALAARLGISLSMRSPATPDELDKLLLEPQDVTEDMLDRLFGLVDTTRDPLAADPTPELLTWRLQHLRTLWQTEDWSEDPGRRPLVDPDLIGPGDLKNPTVGDPAFDLWKARRDWVDSTLTGLRLAREAEPSTLAGLDAILSSTFGARVSPAELVALADQENHGHDISTSLNALSVAHDAFSYLIRIRRLAEENASILDSEWEDIYSILAHVQKRQAFADWRQEEQDAGIVVSADHFRIPEPPPLVFPPPEPPSLPAWRADWQDRRDWQRTLQSRIEQEQATIDALKRAVGAVEEESLPTFRDGLIMAAITKGATLHAKATWFTEQFAIDALMNGCYKTIRIAQAIETLQGIFFSVRTGQLQDSHPNLTLDAPDFDEEWKWLGSYGTWRAAMLVFLYPENLLQPHLRRWQTPAFRKLVDDLRANPRLTPNAVCAVAQSYADYFHDICSLTLEASCQTLTHIHSGDCRSRTEEDERDLVYLFARGGLTNTVYWSSYDPAATPEYAHSLWETVPGLGNAINIIGAVAFATAPESRFLLLFARTGGAGDEKLVFARYDLGEQRWTEEPTELSPPEGTTHFSAVVGAQADETARPHLVIHAPDDGIYSRKLNDDASEWEDADFTKIYEETPGEIGTVLSLFSNGEDNRLIVGERTGGLKVGAFSDESLPTITTWVTIAVSLILPGSPWIGAFAWSSTSYYVFVKGPLGTRYDLVPFSVSAPVEPAMAGRIGLDRIPPHGGHLVGSPRYVAYQMQVQGEIFLAAFSQGADNSLSEPATIRIAPQVNRPFTIAERMTPSDLQTRRAEIETAYLTNADGPRSNLTYLDEAYYFVPVHMAIQLQRRGEYTAALDWLRTVYDYSVLVAERKIWYGLTQEETITTTYERGAEWLLDPLNPHAVAGTRALAYTRFTLISLVRCLLDFADAEYARDTAESVARARILYMTGLDLLDLRELKQQLDACSNLVAGLSLPTSDPQWAPAFYGLQAQLLAIPDSSLLEATIGEIETALSGNQLLETKFAAVQGAVNTALASSPPPPAFATIVAERQTALPEAHQTLLADQDIFETSSVLVTLVAQDYLNSLSSFPGNGSASSAPLAETPDIASQFRPWWFGLPSYRFCVSPNLVLDALRLHAELNLHKIRTCRNIAGMERPLEPYTAPIGIGSSLPSIGGVGQLVLPGTITYRPTPFRYRILIERAKQLTQLANQFESAMLAALEKLDTEQYNLLKAHQDLSLARDNVRLQNLRVVEAEHGVRLAQLQEERARIHADHYQRLLDEGLIVAEVLALALQAAAVVHLHTAAAITQAMTFGVGGIGEVGSALAATSSLFQMQASFERRRQEWELQIALSQQDVRIGAQQVQLTEDHVRIVAQERVIAERQAEQAERTLEFLANKFTNAELYDWMSDVLEHVYSFFLQHATAVAQVAAGQLAFERQETPPPFIQADYWEAPSEEATGTNGTGPDRRGLTGSARLLQDIYALDQYAFETERRKLQLSKTISLARFAPAEFQHFRETGVMTFATPMEFFDRDFPGHYLRLIRRVRTSVIALIPPTQGIRATLSGGASRVVIGGETFSNVVANRPPESIALSSPRDATGVFELEPQSEMLLPFEGMGVDAAWELRMPKASNFFDYRTIADVLITVEYTALDSFDYRQQVIQSLSPIISADRPFSFRHQLADQWYDLHNPAQTATPMVVRFTTRREDFPPNLESVTVQHVVLYVARRAGAAFEVEVSHLHFTEQSAVAQVGGGATSIDGVVSTRRGNAGAWTALIGASPFGEWELALPDTEGVRNLFKNQDIEDILFVITYSGSTLAWPA